MLHGHGQFHSPPDDLSSDFVHSLFDHEVGTLGHLHHSFQRHSLVVLLGPGSVAVQGMAAPLQWSLVLQQMLAETFFSSTPLQI